MALRTPTAVATVLATTAALTVSGIVLSSPAHAADTVYLVRDVRPGLGDGNPTDLTEFQGQLYFSAADFSSGGELRRTDGTADGTVVVKELGPGAQSSTPRHLTVVGETLFFAASAGGLGYELWKTDGTAAGTVLVKDIKPDPAFPNSFPEDLVAVGDRLYFTADDGVHGRELWTSDGTSAGTTLVADLRPGEFGSHPMDLAGFDGHLFFGADDGTAGQELWRTDGTTVGTTLVKDFGTTGPLEGHFELTELNGSLYLAANDGTHGQELWTTDGTPEGTTLVADLLPGPGWGLNDGGGLSGLTTFDGNLYFGARDADHGFELWRSDGTEDGTTMVKDIAPGASHSLAFPIAEVGGALLLRAQDAAHGSELWRSDGTEAGTTLVEDVRPGPEGSYLDWPATAGGVLYFSADDGMTGTDLWRSDGTAAGTEALDVAPSANSYPDELTEVGDSLYFAADHGAYGRELWRAVPNGGDTVPPETTITSGPADGSTIPSGTSAVFAFTGTPGNTAWFECALDDDPVILCKSPFTWTGDRLGDGSHTFRVRAFNSVGNPDPTWAQRTFTATSGSTPPPPTSPSNAFSAPSGGKADTKKGTLALAVKLPGAGKLQIGPSAGSPVKAASVTVGSAGTTTITLKLTKPGMKQLKKKRAQALAQGKKVGKLKVAVTLTFKPTGGTSRSRTASYVVKLK